MISVVIDTNLVVSGFLWDGSPSTLIRLTLERKVQPVVSEVLIAELERVINRSKFAARLKIVNLSAEDVVRDYRKISKLVMPAVIDPVITADPTDDKILACALGGKANFIISGDAHLRELGTYADIPIVTVNQFLERFASDEPAE